MPPSSASFSKLNLPSESTLPECMSAFTLSAPSHTDLWQKPPTKDTITCPILYTSLLHPFIAAEVTVSADWELEWDQAGLVIFAGRPPGRSSQPAPLPELSDGRPPEYTQPATVSKWVKAGLEFTGNACHASSTCAMGNGADSSLALLSPRSPTAGGSNNFIQQRSELRVKMERVGHSLWIWFDDGGAGWKKFREVNWFFWGVEDKSVRVGVYASRPANFGPSMYSQRHGGAGNGQRSLAVDFEGLEIF